MTASTAATRKFHSPAEAGRILGVNDDKVRKWIEDGELQAVNIAQKQDGRPRYRISQQALDEFLSRRTVGPQPKPARRQRPTYTEFVPHT